MVILDTNVIAELMREQPAPAVLAWMNEQRAATLYLTAITVGEIAFGIRILPPGKRRLQLEEGFGRVLATAFVGRILDFDEAAARWYAEILGRRREIGRPLSLPDAQIAAIARRQGWGLATRNVRDFVECGLDVVNPFDAS